MDISFLKIMRHSKSYPTKKGGIFAEISLIGTIHEGLTAIKKMSKKEFHQKVMGGIGQKQAFGAVASFGAKNTSPEQKAEVKKDLASIGILLPSAPEKSDEIMDLFVAAISARAVNLR